MRKEGKESLIPKLNQAEISEGKNYNFTRVTNQAPKHCNGGQEHIHTCPERSVEITEPLPKCDLQGHNPVQFYPEHSAKMKSKPRLVLRRYKQFFPHSYAKTTKRYVKLVSKEPSHIQVAPESFQKRPLPNFPPRKYNPVHPYGDSRPGWGFTSFYPGHFPGIQNFQQQVIGDHSQPHHHHHHASWPRDTLSGDNPNPHLTDHNYCLPSKGAFHGHYTTHTNSVHHPGDSGRDCHVNDPIQVDLPIRASNKLVSYWDLDLKQTIHICKDSLQYWDPEDCLYNSMQSLPSDMVKGSSSWMEAAKQATSNEAYSVGGCKATHQQNLQQASQKMNLKHSGDWNRDTHLNDLSGGNMETDWLGASLPTDWPKKSWYPDLPCNTRLRNPISDSHSSGDSTHRTFSSDSHSPGDSTCRTFPSDSLNSGDSTRTTFPSDSQGSNDSAGRTVPSDSHNSGDSTRKTFPSDSHNSGHSTLKTFPSDSQWSGDSGCFRPKRLQVHQWQQEILTRMPPHVNLESPLACQTSDVLASAALTLYSQSLLF